MKIWLNFFYSRFFISILLLNNIVIAFFSDFIPSKYTFQPVAYPYWPLRLVYSSAQEYDQFELVNNPHCTMPDSHPKKETSLKPMLSCRGVDADRQDRVIPKNWPHDDVPRLCSPKKRPASMNESYVVQLRGAEGPANDGSNLKCGPPRGSKLVDIRFLIARWPTVTTVEQHRTSRLTWWCWYRRRCAFLSHAVVTK